MTKIIFEQFERECNWNKQVREKKTSTRELIQDFKAIINGEWRATFFRKISGKGYLLKDVDGLYTFEVGSQAEFSSAIVRLIDANRIPTLHEIEMDRVRDAADHEYRQRHQRAEDIKHTKERAAEQMYDALVALREYCDRHKLQDTSIRAVYGLAIRALIDADNVPKREDE